MINKLTKLTKLTKSTKLNAKYAMFNMFKKNKNEKEKDDVNLVTTDQDIKDITEFNDINKMKNHIIILQNENKDLSKRMMYFQDTINGLQNKIETRQDSVIELQTKNKKKIRIILILAAYSFLITAFASTEYIDAVRQNLSKRSNGNNKNNKNN